MLQCPICFAAVSSESLNQHFEAWHPIQGSTEASIAGNLLASTSRKSPGSVRPSEKPAPPGRTLAAKPTHVQPRSSIYPKQASVELTSDDFNVQRKKSVNIHRPVPVNHQNANVAPSEEEEEEDEEEEDYDEDESPPPSPMKNFVPINKVMGHILVHPAQLTRLRPTRHLTSRRSFRAGMRARRWLARLLLPPSHSSERGRGDSKSAASSRRASAALGEEARRNDATLQVHGCIYAPHK